MEQYNNIKKILNYINEIEKIKTKITSDNYKAILNDLYNYVKKIIPFYYNNKHYLPYYQQILSRILDAEGQINENIIDTKIPFKMKKKNNDFLENLIHETRLYLLSIYYEEKLTDKLLGGVFDVDLVNYCKLSAEYIQKECESNNIKSKIICIAPGYDEKSSIYLGSGFHFFNLITYNNNEYLVDVTYSQFFKASTNNLNRLGIIYISGCDVGHFILLTPEGKNITNDLIKDGYTIVNNYTLKTYLDAFTISYRNGLYYEKNNDFSYKTDYSLADYEKFLYTNENQVQKEGYEVLGYQKKPLKNPELKFES